MKIGNTIQEIRQQKEECDRVKHLHELHTVDKYDDLKWRNSKAGKQWIQDNEVLQSQNDRSII